MSDDVYPPEKDGALPLSVDDFLRPGRVGLLMWDLQIGLAGKSPAIGRITENAQRLIAAADRIGVPVFWSRHVLPPLAKTAGPFLLFLMKKQNVDRPSKLRATMQQGMDDVGFVPGLKPAPHHLVIEKSQPSLFVDTPLALRMRTLGLDTLVIAGVATDIGVEFNCRHAAALGFYSVVAEDACGAYSIEAHERSIAFLRSWITPVLSTERICQAWDGPAP